MTGLGRGLSLVGMFVALDQNVVKLVFSYTEKWIGYHYCIVLVSPNWSPKVKLQLILFISYVFDFNRSTFSFSGLGLIAGFGGRGIT